MGLIRKINEGLYPLSGKYFEILRPDRTVIFTNPEDLKQYQSGKGEPGTMQKRVSGNAGAIYIGKLGLGTYYLHETNEGRWFKVEVTDDSGEIKAVVSQPISNPFE